MQVLLNLQSNALKFTRQGHVEIESSIIESPERDIFLHISVNDTGVGISENDKSKLFKLFGFIDKENMNTSGIGLGLVIS